MSAHDKVLGTAELLSLVLLNLDQRTLLVAAQRVCRAWRHEIRSPPLQRRLFLQPSSELQPGGRVLNPLLVEAFPSCFKTRSLLQDTEPSLPTSGTSLAQKEADFTTLKLFVQSKLYSSRGNNNPFLRENASWLLMQVSNPPTTTLAWHSGQFNRHAYNETECKQYPDGLQMKDLYGLILCHAFRTTDWFNTESHTTMVYWPDGKSKIRSADTMAFRGRDFRDAWMRNPDRDPYDEIDRMDADVLVQVSRSVGCLVFPDMNSEMRRFWDDCGFNPGIYKGYKTRDHSN